MQRHGQMVSVAHEMYPRSDPLQSVLSDLIQLQLDVSRDLYQENARYARARPCSAW
ncbi:MAG: hypothetical protein KF871_02910 [Hydrogenophaga sp.]|uniref:hypothetical protein n=1 Tax=Hydrogenophaga sp. TaxID=1904254 RepID=UPI001D7517BE|nr:hypothetical protein [Hydrogenophaga sp.]MBX3608822.1 hypothetical protein [Hydrogenophaga sp.]